MTIIIRYSFVNTAEVELKHVGPVEAEANLLMRNVIVIAYTLGIY